MNSTHLYELGIDVDDAPDETAAREIVDKLSSDLQRENLVKTPNGDVVIKWTPEASVFTLATTPKLYTDTAVKTHAEHFIARSIDELHTSRPDLFGVHTRVRVKIMRTLSEVVAIESFFEVR